MPDDSLFKSILRTQDRGRVLGFVRRIRAVLALNGYSFVVKIGTAAFTHGATRKPVTSVDLDSGLGSQHLQQTAALGGIQLGGGLQLARLVTIYHPAVVISLTILQSGEIILDFGSNLLEFLEIHRGSGDRIRLTKRDQGLVGRKVYGSIEFQLVAENIPIAFSVEVEISMIGKIDDGGLVRPGGQIELESVVISPLVTRDNLHVARISGLAILREIHELYGILSYPAVPHLVLKSLRTSVKVVGTIVNRQGIFDTVKGEFPFGDPVGISSRAFSGTGAVSEIAGRVRISQDHISKFSVLVRDSYGDDSGSDTREPDEGAAPVLDGVKNNLFSVRAIAITTFLSLSKRYNEGIARTL